MRKERYPGIIIKGVLAKSQNVEAFTDSKMENALKDALMRIKDANKAKEELDKISNVSKPSEGEENDRIKDGLSYWACGVHFLAEDRYVESAQAFHFAGHQLRLANRVHQSARAYKFSGLIYTQHEFESPEFDVRPETMLQWHKRVDKKLKHIEKQIRSYARAKASYLELGMTEEADCAYVYEQRSRREQLALQYDKAEAEGCGKNEWRLIKIECNQALLFIWEMTCLFGTSKSRWLGCVAAVLSFFTLLYWFGKIPSLCAQTGLIPKMKFADALLLAFQTTATYSPSEKLAEDVSGWMLLANHVCGYGLLAIGATILLRTLNTR